MDSTGLTRRSLLAAGALAAAGGLWPPGRALARLARGAGGLPLVESGLQAGPGQPPIIARSAWAHGGAPPKVAPEYGSVQLAFVHHTENPDGYAAGAVPGMLRAIYEFHRFGRGWNDIGYNFVIDRFGRIWEARAGGIDEAVVGAQAGGYNAYSTGIAILGSYGATRISTAAQAALEHLIAWKLSLHSAPCQGRVTVRVTRGGAIYSRFPAGARVSLPRIAGHRDADSTDCPGDALYGQLAGVRHAAAALAGTPARLTLQSLIGPGGVTSGAIGSLRRLDGSPIAAGPIAIEQRSLARRGEIVRERALAQATTDEQGSFSLAFSSFTPARKHETPLRAVFAGASGTGACVSEPLTLAGVPGFAPTPAPASAPTPAAAASRTG
ncbi:MAG TPA: N-acetylmuramoyl-L-alanine amidase [Solirubrobacteraceae bacterium]|nr:N-acetylmuramoyl-L-alanine amidase [Solirubrobacteraceae bacterium]